MDAFLAELWALFKANAAATLAVMGTVVTAWLTLRSKNRETAVGARKVAIEGGKLDLDRQTAVDQRFDRLVAHLERQHEQAQKERDELRTEVRALTRETRWLRARVEELTTFIRGKGFDPPAERPREEG